MDISSLSGLSGLSTDYLTSTGTTSAAKNTSDGSFDSILSGAMNMIGETNDYQNAAESAEIQFALGESVSSHDLQVAQQKANVALQYTVAVRDRVIEAYNQIMNIQI